MDEIALLRALVPGTAGRPEAVARAAALRALEASFERASAAPSIRTRRRRALALAGAGAMAAIVTGILVLSSGPSAEPAAAEVLRHTAAVAATTSTQPESTPGPGQFLYMKTKSLDLEEWVPGYATFGVGGVAGRQKGAFNALIQWREEAWLSAKQRGRQRLVMESPRFLSSAERRRWERAGSPPPVPFDDKRGREPGVRVIEERRGVRDVEGINAHVFPDLSGLPTEPRALRLAIEGRQPSGRSSGNEPTAKPMDTGRVIGELWGILDKPNTTPALRAAVFGALAEEPGIALNRHAKDLVGRPGSALSYESPNLRGYGEQRSGVRVEYIFDPRTSAILGRRQIVTDPETRGIPAGTVIREVAYLESGVVDSTHARPDTHKRGPIATASTDQHKEGARSHSHRR